MMVSGRLSPLLLPLLLPLWAPTARAAGPGTLVGILPVAGARSAQLNPALGRAVSAQGSGPVLGPLEVRARFAADPEIADRLRRARRAVAKAREQELLMNRGPAVEAAALAVRLLEEARAVYYQRRLVVQAYKALALAQLLRPADPVAARSALRRALANAPELLLTAQLPPRAAELLEQERRQRPSVLVPASTDLAWLAGRAAVSWMVWVQIADDGQVTVLVHDGSGGATQTVQGTSQPKRTIASVARLVRDALSSAGRGALQAPARRSPHRSHRSPRPPPPPPSPWYTRWWLWTTVGVVVAGAAVGAGFAISEANASRPYRLQIHF